MNLERLGHATLLLVLAGVAACGEVITTGPATGPIPENPDNGFNSNTTSNNNGGGDDDDDDGGGGGDEGEGEGEGGGDGGDCESEVVPLPTSAVCAASTDECLTACEDSGTEDDACYDNCIAADPAGEACSECTDDAFIACTNAAGCQAQYDAVVCCADTQCADPESDECYEVTCATEEAAWEACLDANGESCDDSVCFASP